MNVYILEDQLFHQQRLENALKYLAKSLGIPLKLEVTTGKPTELMEAISAYGPNQIYFLDIKLKENSKNGLEVAQSIREKDRTATIIFVTTYSEFASITYRYKVAALGFIDKDQKEKDFCQDLANYLQYIDQNQKDRPEEDVFEIHQKSRYIKIPFQDINYIETGPLPHKLALRTNQKRIEFYQRMKDIEKQEPRLFRAHKAFLINPQKVVEINRRARTITFSGGQSCLISRRKIKPLEDLLKTESMLVTVKK